MIRGRLNRNKVRRPLTCSNEWKRKGGDDEGYKRRGESKPIAIESSLLPFSYKPHPLLLVVVLVTAVELRRLVARDFRRRW